MRRQPFLALLILILLGTSAGRSDGKALPERDRLARLLRHGTALGIPTTFVPAAPERSMAVGDWNEDGVLDLAVAEPGSGKVWLLPGDGAGGFERPTLLATPVRQTVVAVADFDGDGLEDRAVTDQFSAVTTLLPGGTLATPVL